MDQTPLHMASLKTSQLDRLAVMRTTPSQLIGSNLQLHRVANDKPNSLFSVKSVYLPPWPTQTRVIFPLCFACLYFICRLGGFVTAGNIHNFHGRMNCAICCSLVVGQTVVNVPRLLLIGLQPSFSDQCEA